MTAPQSPPTLGGLFARAAGRAMIVVAAIALLVGAYAYWQRRGKPYEDPRTAAATWCRERYAAARTASDSSAVDTRHPPGGSGAQNSVRLCHELRLAHLTDPGSAR